MALETSNSEATSLLDSLQSRTRSSMLLMPLAHKISEHLAYSLLS